MIENKFCEERDFEVVSVKQSEGSPASVTATAQAYGVSPIFVEGTAHMVPVEAEPQAFAKLLLKNPVKMPRVCKSLQMAGITRKRPRRS